MKCNNWWYFKCDKTNSEEVEQKFGEIDYICKLHEEREKLNKLKEKLIHRDDIITQLKNENKLSKEQNNSNKDQIDNKDQQIKKLKEGMIVKNKETLKQSKKNK